MSLLKEELSCVPVWVKFHDVHLVAYTSDGLSCMYKLYRWRSKKIIF